LPRRQIERRRIRVTPHDPATRRVIDIGDQPGARAGCGSTRRMSVPRGRLYAGEM
jgi:hypothetical protein